MIRGYDDSFFADKALIVMQFLGGNEGNGYTHKIKSIKIEKETLTVERHDIRKKGTWEDYAVSHVALIEVNKADIGGVVTAEIKVVNK